MSIVIYNHFRPVPMASAQITLSTAAVMHALALGPRYGFDLVNETGLPSGTVYPMLRRLLRAGLVTARWERERDAHEAQRPQRRYYTLTARGRRTLDEALVRFPALQRGPSVQGAPRPAT